MANEPKRASSPATSSGDNEPYADVKADAERLTKARLEAGKSKSVDNDLSLVPIVQATTPSDEESKKQNTGGVEVSGSPEQAPSKQSDGFNDQDVLERGGVK